MSKPWDHTMKQLARANAQDFVSWILQDGVYRHHANVEVKTDSYFADVMYSVQCQHQEIILHIEFQRHHDATMSKRVWIYNTSTCIHSNVPVYSVVIYLAKDALIQEPTYEVKLPSGKIIHQFFFENIKLWEISPETLIQQNLPGLLPLLPLTKDGHQRTVIERMIGEMQKQANSKDLLALGFGVATLVLKKNSDEQWLKERFKHMSELLEDSWLFQEINEKGYKKGIQEGRQEGRMEQARQSLLQFVEARFPTLLAIAKHIAKELHSMEQVHALLHQLYHANTVEEAQAALLQEES